MSRTFFDPAGASLRVTAPDLPITLRPAATACYVAELKLSIQQWCGLPHFFCNIFNLKCHISLWVSLLAFLVLPALSPGQIVTKIPARQGAPQPGWVRISADSQESQNHVYKLRGHAKVETAESLLEADEIDYNDETGEAEARVNVKYKNYVGGEQVRADKVKYNVVDETGWYLNISGTSPAKIQSRPGVLTTTNPFYFQGKWAERKEDRYFLHDGFVTDCRMPGAWWRFHSPLFDVIPGQRAIGHKTVFRLRGVPLFYTPFFYKSLKKEPRQSGFLAPNVGHSTRYGYMTGLGYYWAINRSYDATYLGQYFSLRGLAHHVDFRGKPNTKSDFNVILYGVNDKLGKGGYLLTAEGHTELPWGFTARGSLNQLSSFQFRQEFSESFYEAVFSESHSIGFLTKHWSSFDFNIVAQRDEEFYVTPTGDVTTTTIHKFPSAEFGSKDRLISDSVLPIWVSFDSSAGLMGRTQPLFQTRESVQRFDVEPRIMTTFALKEFHFTPSFTVAETNYGSSFFNSIYNPQPAVMGANVLRSSRDFRLDMAFPSLARVYDAPKWMGTKLKHVIEPRVEYRNVSGIDNFDRIIRFDETDLLSDTNQLEISLMNRFYVKRKDDRVEEVLSWQLTQVRYFDPTFGGAVVQGQRNVVEAVTELTAYTFLDGPRNYSPVISALRAQLDPRLGFEWRTDYDPLRGHLVNSGVTVDGRFSKYFISLGHNQVRSSDVLTPNADQFRGLVGIGDQNKKGWNAAFSAIYDYHQGVMQYATTQVTYNTDCCGFSVEYRRFSFGTRNENQYKFAFSIANVGSFGTLKRQERIF